MSQDLLWETWCRYRYNDISPTLTPSERGRINKALKELRSVGATPETLLQKCKAHKMKWPKLDVTITSIAANWNSLEVKQKSRGTAHFHELYVSPEWQRSGK